MKVVNGAEIRPVLKGKLATGEGLEVHETTLPPSSTPQAAHHHVHSEMWLIPGRYRTAHDQWHKSCYGTGFGRIVRSNDEHGIKNVGTTPATYFVVVVGPGRMANSVRRVTASMLYRLRAD